MRPILNLSRTATRNGRDESRWKAFLWPRLESQPDIDGALDRGTLFAFIVAGAGALFVIFRILPLTSLVDCALFAGFGFGIAKRSRVCAIGAFALYLLGRIDALDSGSRWGLGIVIGVMILAVFFNAVRATFAHHRIGRRNTAARNEGQAVGQG